MSRPTPCAPPTRRGLGTRAARALAALALPGLLALAAPAWAGQVTLQATDGTALHAELEGDGTEAVVLLHGASDDADRSVWREVGPALTRAGFRVLALDLRGYGATPGARDEATQAKLAADVTQAVTWLQGKGATKVSLVGAGEGGALALSAAGEAPEVSTVVWISPRLSGFGYKAGGALKAYGDRPLMLVASSADTAGVRAAGALSKNAGGESKVELVDKGEMGPQLFSLNPALAGTLVSWLQRGGDAGPGTGPRTEALRASDGGSIETTGKRIGEE